MVRIFFCSDVMEFEIHSEFQSVFDRFLFAARGAFVAAAVAQQHGSKDLYDKVMNN